MKTSVLSAVAVVALVCSCKQAEDKAAADRLIITSDNPLIKPMAEKEPIDSAVVAKAWEDYRTPGDVHSMLAQDTGIWTEEMTIWTGVNDNNPQKFKLTAECTMILGGRYQQMRHIGKVMGADFEGIGTVGYDNATNQLFSTYIDNMGTGTTLTKGAFYGNAKVLTLRGETVDPVSKMPKPIRKNFTFVDIDTRKFEMFDTDHNNKEYKSMEIIMKRSK